MVEGVFARAFRSELRPVEVGRRMIKEMEGNRTVDVRGRTVVPNAYTISLSPDALATFEDIHSLLIRELCDAARDHARDQGWGFVGPVEVDLVADPGLKSSTVRVEARMKEQQSGTRGAALVLADGNRLALSNEVVSVGRLHSCTIPLPDDTHVSRHHADFRPSGTGWVVVDNNSTNGTRVNGVIVTEHRLSDGDVVTIGNARMVFEGL